MTYEQLENCYKTALKQRDEAEAKIAILVNLIEDDLWPASEEKQAIATNILNEMRL